jgi:hypothetical protein
LLATSLPVCGTTADNVCCSIELAGSDALSGEVPN